MLLMNTVWLVCTFLFSFITANIYKSYAIKQKILDVPEQRSSHDVPTPRGGGISFIIIWALSAFIAVTLFDYEKDYLISMALGLAVVVFVGLADDIKNISPLFRILAHFFAGLLLGFSLDWWGGVDLSGFSILGWLGVFCLIFFTAWSINLFNFMDGLNGMASAEAISIFSFGGWFMYMSGGTEEAMMSWLLAASVAGFMVLNFPQAKLFMGDSGSGFLGFMVAAFATVSVFRFHTSYLLWAILYSVFLFDATVTLLRRMWRNEKWYKAHRNHAYQRLQRSGWSHKRVTLSVLLLNIFFGIGATYSFLNPSVIYQVLLLDISILSIIYFLIEKKFPMREDEG